MDYPYRAIQRAGSRGQRLGDFDQRPKKPRPISRRGLRESSSRNSSTEVANNQRVSSMRPGSAYRGGTASRLATNNFGAPPPSAVRVGTAGIGGLNMASFDRPITQQGLSGLRTGTGMGRTRQLRDRRYWEEILGARVRALRAEVARLNQAADTAARERSANKHYEARGRELAQELTDLQGRLSDYNLASQLLTASDVTALQRQTSELEVANHQASTKLETVFSERQRKEGQLRQIMEQVNKEQGAVESLIDAMTPSEKERFMELKRAVSNLQEDADQSRVQLDELNRVKNELEKQVSLSQMKTHMVDLLRKLMGSEEKRDSLQKEMNNKLQPAQERDQLLTQVREDNSAIASMESNSQSVKEEIKRAQEQLDQAEQDLEEGQSERHQKYRELKKREETMETFMLSFEKNVADEKTRLAQLESDIVFAFEHTSSNLDQLNFDEIDNLKQKDGGYSSLTGLEADNSKSTESLMREYTRLDAQLKKTEATRERLAAEMAALPEKIIGVRQSIEALSDLDTLRAEGGTRRKELKEEAASLREKLGPTESAVKEAASRYRELQKRLDGNEMYSQLNAMEERLASIQNNNVALKEDIASITIKTDYEPIKKQALDALKTLNERLSSSANNQVY